MEIFMKCHMFYLGCYGAASKTQRRHLFFIVIKSQMVGCSWNIHVKCELGGAYGPNCYIIQLGHLGPLFSYTRFQKHS